MDALKLYAESQKTATTAPADDALSIYAGSQQPKAAAAGPGVQAFVQQYQPLAERIAKTIGVAPEALLGQWGLETGWGKSVIPGTFNLGNIKANNGKGVAATDNMTGSRDPYRAYGSADEFGDDFAGLIARRYRSAAGAGADAQRYFTALKAGGYAEDPDYVKKGVAAADMARSALGGTPSQEKRFVGANYTPPPERSVLEKMVIDPAVALGSGLASGVSSLASVAGADNPVATGAREFSEFIQGQESEGRKAERLARARAIREASDSGSTWDEIKAGAGAFLEAPILTTLNAVGSTAPTLLSLLIPGLGQSNAVRLIVQGAVGAAQGAGAVKGSIYEAVKQRLEEEGEDPDVAAKVAAGAQAYASENADQIGLGAGIGALAGTTGAEGAVRRLVGGQVGRQAGESAVRAAGRGAVVGAVSEAPVEGAQGAQEQVAGNVALQREGYDVPTFQGAAAQGAMEAMAGGGVGGGVGAVTGALSPIQPVMDEAAKPNSPLSRAATANPDAAAAAVVGQQQAAAQQLQAEQQAANPPAEPPKPATDELRDRAREISGTARDSGLLDRLRGDDSPMKSGKFLADLAAAQSMSAAPASREAAMARIETAQQWLGVDLAPRAEAAPRGEADPILAAIDNPAVSPQDRAAMIEARAASENPQLLPGQRDAVMAPAREIAGRYAAPPSQSQQGEAALLQAPAAETPATLQAEADRSETGAFEFAAEGFEQDAQALRDEADRLREQAATLRAEQIEQERARQPKPIEPAKVTPPGEGSAAMRRRRSSIAQLVANGFSAIERDNEGPVLRNTKTGQSYRLDGLADAQLARKAIADYIALQAAATNTAPTDGQKQAGNYRKGRVEFDGLKIAIENPVGSERRGKSPDGTEWRTPMRLAHYGYVERTEAADGDQVDVYVAKTPRPGAPAFVIDQYNADGTFDEAKTILGVTSETEATRIYDAGFSDGSGPRRRGAVTRMPIEQFREWANSPAAKKPAGPEPKLEGKPMTITVNGTKVRIGLVKAPEGSEALIALAETFGKKVQFFNDPSGMVGDGFVRSGGDSTIFINANSAIEPVAVFGHELLHLVKRESPEAHAAMEAAVKARLKDGAAESMKKLGYQDGEVLEEITSDLGGDFMTDPNFWAEVFDQVQKEHGEKAQGILVKLAAIVRAALEKVAGVAKKYNAAELVNDVESIRIAFKDGLAKYIADNKINKAQFGKELLKAQQAAKRSAPRDVTQTEAFKRWFGDSKVVDEQGRPLVVYHGTHAGEPIERFSEDKIGSRTDEGFMGRGFYFGDSIDASSYAGHHPYSDPNREPTGGSVYPAYLSLQNPLVLYGRKEGERVKRMPDRGVLAREAAGLPRSTRAPELRARLEEMGHDGVIYKDELGTQEYVAFRPEQIKSATGNRGTFDPKDADITRSAPRTLKAIHYGRQPRETLDGRFNGTGLKGAEAKRLESATDPRIKERVYAYLNGREPEAGVGGYAHEVELGNLYDAQANADGLWQADANAAESAILDAGYDGYFVGDIAVVMGKASHNVKAKPLTAEPVKPAPVKKGLMSLELNSIDVAKIPGAQLRAGTLIVPPNSVTAANDELARIGSAIRFSKARDIDLSQTRVLDKDGKPATLYHGTANIEGPIDEFRVGRGLYGDGVYLTGVPGRADAYTSGRQGHVYPLKADIRNPISADDFVDRFGRGIVSRERSAEIRQILLKEGYDGIVDKLGDKYWEVVALKPGSLAFALEIPEADIVQSKSRPEESEAFKRWFGDSRVVDADGKPLVVFHGTRNDFDEFKSGRAEGLGGRGEAGFYFTPVEWAAESISENIDGAGKPRVIAAYLSLQNPVDVDMRGRDGSVTERLAQAEADGHDGAIIRNWNDGTHPDDGDPIPAQYVAFRPEQIKSATGNRGTFDPEDADITRSVPRSSRTIIRKPADFKEAYGLNEKTNGVREIGEALNRRTVEDFGQIPDNDTSSESRDAIAEAMADEVEHQMGKVRSSGAGWYSKDYPKALRALGAVYPELQRSPGARATFTALLAVTSNGERVARNISMARQLYEVYREGGDLMANIPGTKRQDALRGNIEVIAQMLAEHGPNGMSKVLLEEMRVGDINAQLRKLGQKPSSDYPASMTMPRAALYFGPKLGAFYANLMGTSGYLTMDLWWSRTFNRMRGTLIPQPTLGAIEYMRGAMGKDDATLDELIAFAEPYERAYYRRGYKNGSELEKRANTFIKAAVLELNEAPSRASDREFMFESAAKAQELLKQRGIDMTIADIQAALWYYEKRLYGALGSRVQEDIGYSEALKNAAQGDRPQRPASRSGGAADAAAADGIVPAQQEAAGGDEVRRSAGRDGGGQQPGAEEALPGAPRVAGATGPDPRLVAVAESYAQKVGVDLRRQAEYAEVDEARAKRIADAYEAMEHAPQDPRVQAAYAELIRQTRAQYDALAEAGYSFYFADQDNDPYQGNPWNAMRELRAGQRMAVFPTAAGFGSDASFDPAENPLLADTGLVWGYGSEDGPGMRVLANDLFRAVHDAFGHGLEGAGFRAQGEENAWQAHVRLFTGDAVGAITSETRGQNSWLNYSEVGERNRTAKVENTVFADQKTGLMPEWTWSEGRVGDMPSSSRPVSDERSYNERIEALEALIACLKK
jgi:hypothetical protein